MATGLVHNIFEHYKCFDNTFNLLKSHMERQVDEFYFSKFITTAKVSWKTLKRFHLYVLKKRSKDICINASSFLLLLIPHLKLLVIG